MEITVTHIPVPSQIGPTALTQNEINQLMELAKDKIVLECGAELGTSTLALARTAKKVYSVDHQRGDPCASNRQDIYIEPIKGFPIHLWEFYAQGWIHLLFQAGQMDKVIPILGDFADVLPKLGQSCFDMAFLDGDHRKEFVQRDIDLIIPRLCTGAILAVHDYGRFDVKPVVDALGLNIQTVETLAWVIVP